MHKFLKFNFIMQRFVCLIMAAFLVTVAFSASIRTADAAATITRHDGQVIKLEVNQGLLLKLDREAANIFIANGHVADIEPKSTKLFYIFARLPGVTTLYAVDSNDEVIYSATVEVTLNIARLQETIDALIPTASIKVDYVSGIIFLTGNALAPEDASLAEQIVMDVMVVNITDDDGSATLLRQKVINRIVISTPTQVNLRVKMAEMSRNTMKTLGFNWDVQSFGGSLFGFNQGAGFINRVINETGENFPERTFSRTAGTNSLLFSDVSGSHDINALVDALESEGYISILAEPNLTAISGETASFLAGGEFPVPIPRGSFGSGLTIQFKQFGVGLSFTPTVLSENKINLKVAPEVSQLSTTGAVTVDGITIPALTTRRANTTVELASGQSFAIAGLLQSNISQQAEKFPWLADIPILGTLFRSDTFKREETELVIIVTPYIVRPVNGERLLAPTDINHLPMDAGRYIKGRRDLAGSGGLKTDDR